MPTIILAKDSKWKEEELKDYIVMAAARYLECNIALSFNIIRAWGNSLNFNIKMTNFFNTEHELFSFVQSFPLASYPLVIFGESVFDMPGWAISRLISSGAGYAVPKNRIFEDTVWISYDATKKMNKITTTILAHEIGHILGLPHYDLNSENIMARGEISKGSDGRFTKAQCDILYKNLY
jgi:hypothetical protein